MTPRLTLNPTAREAATPRMPNGTAISPKTRQANGNANRR